MSSYPDPERDGSLQPADSPAGTSPWCATCMTDEYLMLHSIEPIDAHTGSLLVHVTYTCAVCGHFGAHAAPFRQVATLLNESELVPGVLHFGDTYMHCGQPLAEAGASEYTIQAPTSTFDQPESALADVVLPTRALRCACGFRIQLPG